MIKYMTIKIRMIISRKKLLNTLTFNEKIYIEEYMYLKALFCSHGEFNQLLNPLTYKPKLM